jgi:hypothetical protein
VQVKLANGAKDTYTAYQWGKKLSAEAVWGN